MGVDEMLLGMEAVAKELRELRTENARLKGSLEGLELRTAAAVRAAGGKLEWGDEHLVQDGGHLAWGAREVTLEKRPAGGI